MKKLFIFLAISIPFAQKLDPIDISHQGLRTLVENASRASQKVFVEDFTGLN
tara:strand:+ start:717 stop:872 length:156 start_codon:yes stop_codon:yes gene_type:complete